jgi:predicted phage baseplate assembly protein
MNASHARWSDIGAALAVCQPLDACDGADAEPLDAAKARAYRMVSDERCAVTLADLERIALSTPGVPIARARAVAEFHPHLSCLSAAGCVTLVIVPRCVGRNPHPSDAMCRAVANFVERRRPLALEIRVSGPQYTRVTVDARLALVRGTDAQATYDAAAKALREFLHPLSGGPDKKGWAIGRSVYRSEILALLDILAGVDYVSELILIAGEDNVAQCGDIALCPNGLVISGHHRIHAV